MEHKNEKTKVCKSECKKVCAKNMSCFKKECHCLKKLAKQLAFLMLVVITISVASIACMMHRHHKTMNNNNHYGMEIPMHNLYR